MYMLGISVSDANSKIWLIQDEFPEIFIRIFFIYIT